MSARHVAIHLQTLIPLKEFKLLFDHEVLPILQMAAPPPRLSLYTEFGGSL